MLPASYVVQPELIRVGEYGWGGGFAGVSKGEYRGRPVAIKHLRIKTKDEFEKIFKVSVARGRSHCSHLYSIPRDFVGKSSFGSGCLIRISCLCWEFPCLRGSQCFRIISEWMPNGDVTEYTSSNPEANRLRLVSPADTRPYCRANPRNLTICHPINRGVLMTPQTKGQVGKTGCRPAELVLRVTDVWVNAPSNIGARQTGMTP